MGHGAWDTGVRSVSAGEEVRSFRDLKLYQMLCELHLRVCEVSRRFPQFETYELGSQLRRASNSIPANIAEGSGNKHLPIYLEALNRALGELRETLHHLLMAHRKGYLTGDEYSDLCGQYESCARMIKALERSLLSRSGVAASRGSP
jgi:four helix bundle protein